MNEKHKKITVLVFGCLCVAIGGILFVMVANKIDQDPDQLGSRATYPSRPKVEIQEEVSKNSGAKDTLNVESENFLPLEKEKIIPLPKKVVNKPVVKKPIVNKSLVAKKKFIPTKKVVNKPVVKKPIVNKSLVAKKKFIPIRSPDPKRENTQLIAPVFKYQWFWLPKTPSRMVCYKDQLVVDKNLYSLKTNGQEVSPPSLFVCVQNDDFEGLKNSIKLGNDLNQADCFGYTPLHKAAEYGHKRIAWELIYRKANIDTLSKAGYTPLHLAAKYGKLSTLKLLLAHKADPLKRTKAGYNTLEIAILANQRKVILCLWNHCPKIFTATQTPIHLAVQHGCLSSLKALLKCKIPITTTGTLSQTPLHIAARYNQVEVLKHLIAAGANINALAIENYTPLHIAAQYGHQEIVKELLEKGVKISAKTRKKETAEILAVKNGHQAIADLLKTKQPFK